MKVFLAVLCTLVTALAVQAANKDGPPPNVNININPAQLVDRLKDLLRQRKAGNDGTKVRTFRPSAQSHKALHILAVFRCLVFVVLFTEFFS